MTLGATLLVVGIVASVALLGTAVSPVAADKHTKEAAGDYTDSANYTVNFLFTTDHYPGDQNEENGSIQYFAGGAEAFQKVDAEEGAFIDYVIVDASWIDYSACDVDNTAVFGIDRGNNNSGTQVDEDLVSQRKDDTFRDDGLTIEFYRFEDFGGDPPYMAPEDVIVAEQGARSQGGACLTVTSEPGWYQAQGFLNGTEADNGPNEEPSADANEAGVNVNSNYLYVCECDSEAEAREQLGPPPNEDGPTDESTPTPTATQTPTATETESGEESTAPTPTATVSNGGDETPTATPTATATGSPTETSMGGNVGANMTPTPGSGPGFGPVVTLLALLAGALFVRRR
ncbi:PGF-CTERM sorting domain-containing protein [Natronomonas sp.]|uniref:PGF-CTERM sorting domain-containing protein n=2 Tax=Natronomonas sp. TaxID=2184060 RepID=UPI0039896D5C